ncbi:phage integrase Arm DNA-binding domain-containing protein [Klebsiella sp. B345]|uniref:phage integrase Arm DNA-binding domain-containing protein n=1 Tax=Klebsiella sp. B345 TaxID=2755398 RepID=UPI003DA8E4F5
MAARPRNHRVDVPNLYCKLDKRNSKTYWQYRHPLTGQFIGFGTVQEAARQAATELNRLLAQQESAQSFALIDMVTNKKANAKKSIRMRVWIERYLKIQEERLSNGEIKNNTLKSRRTCTNVLAERMPDIGMQEVTTKMLAIITDEYKARGKARMAQTLRSVWIDLFREAQHAGEVEPGYNPALATRKVVARVNRSRLNFEMWKAIFEAADNMAPYVQNSMLLALVTGQRRGDIAKMKFSDVWDGYLHVEQQKTGVKLAIPLSLRCVTLDITLAQVIKRCRDRVVSPWLLHHVTSSGSVKASDPVGENSLSVSFKLAVDSTDISVERGKTMPTFHEQRSLSERLHEAQGINTQQLLGHSSEKMTAQYHNDRGFDWVKVKG